MFANREALFERRVDYEHAGSAAKIAAGVTPGVLGRDRESRNVPPLSDGLSAGWNDGYAGHQVRPLVAADAVQHLRRGPGDHDVDRETGPGHQGSAQIPSTNQPGRQTAVQEAAPGAERKLIDRTVGDVLARVIRRDATVAGPAGKVFHPYGFARADRGVRDAFRPLVLRLPQEASGERTLHRHLKRIEIGRASCRARG